MKFILIAFICLFSLNSFAAGEITTLDELIKITLEKNPEIKASRAKFEASAKRPSQEGTLPNPVIGAKYRNASFDELTLGDDPMTNLEFSIKQEVPFPGKLSLKEGIAESESDMQKWNTEAVKRNVLAELKKTYYKWFLVNKSVEITEKNKELLQKLSDIARSKYEVGKGIQQDVTKAQVELSRFLEKLEILKNRERIIKAKLRNITNLSPDENLGQPVKEIKMADLEMQIGELKELVKKNSPILNATSNMIQVKQGALDLARKNYFPDLILSTAYANRGNTGEFDDIWELGVGFKVPLYFWSREKPAVDEASLKLSETRHEYADTANELVYRLNEYYLTADTSENLIDLYQDGIIPQAELSLDSSIAGYQVGKVDFLTLLDNMVTLFTFELEYYRQLVEYQIAVANIEEIAGIEIIDSNLPRNTVSQEDANAE